MIFSIVVWVIQWVMRDLIDVESVLQLQDKMGLVMNETHFKFCGGGRRVRLSYSKLYITWIYIGGQVYVHHGISGFVVLPSMTTFFFLPFGISLQVCAPKYILTSFSGVSNIVSDEFFEGTSSFWYATFIGFALPRSSSPDGGSWRICIRSRAYQSSRLYMTITSLYIRLWRGSVYRRSRDSFLYYGRNSFLRENWFRLSTESGLCQRISRLEERLSAHMHCYIFLGGTACR